EQMPCSGQSLTRPASSLSCTACQRNLPSASRKHMTTPLSPVISLLRGEPLLVPRKILPPDTTALPYDCEPSSTDHLIFFPDLTSRSAGKLRSTELTMFRCSVPPNMGHTRFAPSAFSTTVEAVSATVAPETFRATLARWLRSHAALQTAKL